MENTDKLLENIDKKFVTKSKLAFLNEKDNNKICKLKLTDDGMIEIYNENKLQKTIPFSKLSLVRECKTLLQENYRLFNDDIDYDIKDLQKANNDNYIDFTIYLDYDYPDTNEEGCEIEVPAVYRVNADDNGNGNEIVMLDNNFDGDARIAFNDKIDEITAEIANLVSNIDNIETVEDTSDVECINDIVTNKEIHTLENDDNDDIEVVEEAEIQTNNNNNQDLSQTKEELKQAIADAKEVQELQDELNATMQEIETENKEDDNKKETNVLIPHVTPSSTISTKGEECQDCTVLTEDDEIDNSFPSTALTKKILTIDEINAIDFNNKLTMEQKEWIQNNLNITIQEFTDAIQELANMLPTNNEPAISIDEYINEIKEG